jgi:hypothetical protein
VNKDKCRHFNGVQNKTCEAGINYDTFPSGIPCIRRHTSGHVPPNPPTCEKYAELTPEDIAKREAEIKAAVERFAKLGPVIRKVKQEHKGTSWKGVEVCPICGGKLHMTHAAYNGHVWGKCETKDCVAWME